MLGCNSSKMLAITAALLLVQCVSPTYGACSNAVLENTIVKAHNDLRHDVATKDLNAKMYGDIPGTKSLFNLEFECGFAQLAEALIPKDCLRPALDYSSMGYGSNFKKLFRTLKRVDESDISYLAGYYSTVVQEWAMKDIVPLDADAVYKDESMQAFANMVYYKTIAFGCKHRICDDSTLSHVCTNHYQRLVNRFLSQIHNRKMKKDVQHIRLANKLDQKANVCKIQMVHWDPSAYSMTTYFSKQTTTTPPTSSSTTTTTTPTTTSGITTTSTSSITTSTTTSTSSTTTTTVVPTLMTDEMREELLGELNYYRYEHPPALKRYDMALEAEAQAAADKCEVTSEVQSKDGQIAQLSEASFSDMEVLLATQDSWFWQIPENGMPTTMMYSHSFASKTSSPIAFTSGNQYLKYVYTKGTTKSDICASCSDSCNDGLCPPSSD